MNLLELSVALGVLVVISLSVGVQSHAQFQVARKAQELRFYAADAPRAARALQKMVAGAPTATIHATPGGPPTESGPVLRVQGSQYSGWFYLDTSGSSPELIFHRDLANPNSRWVVGRGIRSLAFAFRPELKDLVEVTLSGGPGGAGAVTCLLERI